MYEIEENRGKFDQRSLNLTFLNEIFYSAYYIPR